MWGDRGDGNAGRWYLQWLSREGEGAGAVLGSGNAWLAESWQGMSAADGDTQHARADPSLHGADRGCIEIGGAVEAQRAGAGQSRRLLSRPVAQSGTGQE